MKFPWTGRSKVAISRLNLLWAHFNCTTIIKLFSSGSWLLFQQGSKTFTGPGINWRERQKHDRSIRKFLEFWLWVRVWVLALQHTFWFFTRRPLRKRTNTTTKARQQILNEVADCVDVLSGDRMECTVTPRLARENACTSTKRSAMQCNYSQLHTWSDHYTLHCCIWNKNSIIILTIFKVV